MTDMPRRVEQYLFFIWCLLNTMLYDLGQASAKDIALQPVISKDGPSKLLQIGDCALSNSDLLIRRSLKACFQSRASAELLFAFERRQPNVNTNFADAYLGVHVFDWLSFHGRVEVEQSQNLKQASTAEASKKTLDKRVDFAFVRLGNPALNRFRLSAGRLSTPFAFNISDAPKTYQNFSSMLFWRSAEYSAVMAYDNNVDTLLELGYGANFGEAVRGGEIDKQIPQQKNGSLRLSYDIPAVEGTRMMMSALADEDGERRVAAGLLNANRRGDLAQIEWIRSQPKPNAKKEPFRQNIRASYTSTWRGSQRWVFQFDSERKRHRMGILNYDLLFLNHLMARFGVLYHKSEDHQTPSFWAITTGLEAKL